jgi:hypothetical protein
MVLEGPDPERDAVIRWRCVDLRDAIAARWSAAAPARYDALQPRPFHPKKNAAAQEAFKKRMARPVCKRNLKVVLIGLRKRLRNGEWEWFFELGHRGRQQGSGGLDATSPH